MTKREEAIEAMARAIETARATVERDIPDRNVQAVSAKHLATAAFDAAAKVLSEPDEVMIAEGFESIRMEEKWPTLMGRVFKAMLKAAANLEDR